MVLAHTTVFPMTVKRLAVVVDFHQKCCCRETIFV